MMTMTGTQRRLAAVAFAGVFSVAVACGAAGQDVDRVREHAGYFEVLGNGGLYSLNYEHRSKPEIRVRVGLTAWEVGGGPWFGESKLVGVPLTVSYVRGARYKFEVGGGVLMGRWRDTSEQMQGFMSVVGIIGFRYEHPWGALIRVGYTPFYSQQNERRAYPEPGYLTSVGMSFGYGF